MSSVPPAMSMTPPTSNTTVRGPGVSIAALSEPGPSAARLVTRRICPPAPPRVAVPAAHIGRADMEALGFAAAGRRRSPGCYAACPRLAPGAPVQQTRLQKTRRHPARPHGCGQSDARRARFRPAHQPLPGPVPARRPCCVCAHPPRARHARLRLGAWQLPKVRADHRAPRPLKLRRVSGVINTGTAPTARSSFT